MIETVSQASIDAQVVFYAAVLSTCAALWSSILLIFGWVYNVIKRKHDKHMLFELVIDDLVSHRNPEDSFNTTYDAAWQEIVRHGADSSFLFEKLREYSIDNLVEFCDWFNTKATRIRHKSEFGNLSQLRIYKILTKNRNR